MIIIKQLAKNY